MRGEDWSITWRAETGDAQPRPGQLYLGQQLGEVLLKDGKGGPAEGQVAGPGFQLQGIACGLGRVLGIRKLNLVSGSGDMERGRRGQCGQSRWSASP